MSGVLEARKKAKSVLASAAGVHSAFELELCRDIVELSVILEAVMIRESRRVLMENEVKD